MKNETFSRVPSADAKIAARGEDASSTRTEYREQVTHSRRIFQRDIRLLHIVPKLTVWMLDWPRT